MHTRWIKSAAVLAAFAVGLTACDDSLEGPGTDTANLQVLLTDAAAEYVDSAQVDIGAVTLMPVDEEAEPVTLTDDGTDGLVNLLELQGEATEQLADATVEAGTYAQLRLEVDSATVELADGYEFNDGTASRTLFVPSGAETGIKLNMAEGSAVEEGTVTFEAGETEVLVLDFDVAQSFVIQGNPETMAGIEDILFTPAIRVAVDDVAGSISGTVSLASSAPDSIEVQDVTVVADPQDDGTLEAYQTQMATATSDSAGAYTINFVVPGTYTVRLTDDYETTPDSMSVTVDSDEDVTGADFEIDALGSGS